MIEQHKATAPVSQLHALDLPPEQPIDVGRYANALRRSKVLIAAIVVAVTAIVLLMSLALPKTYSAHATILFDESQSVTTATSTTDAARQLATIQKLLVTRDVLARSARRLPGETVNSLAGKISASVDPEANIVTITADAAKPQRAARIANIVAAAFLARERSAELAGIRSAEARLQASIKALKGKPGRFPKVLEGGCVDPGIIMDTNPPDDDSWWYQLFEEEKPANAEIFKQPSGRSESAENKAFLPAQYYENLMSGADQDFIRVYVDGLYGYVRDGKPIYPEYNDGFHCADVEPVPGVVIQRGWDFGLTPACIFTQIHPDGRWLIFDELVADDLGIDTFADAVNLHCAQKYSQFKFEDYGDPAGSQRSAMSADKDEKTCFDILRGKGIAIQPSEQNLTIRIESVKKPLNTLHRGKPQLQLHSRCKTLRKGFQGRYQYKRLKIAGTEERFQDTPDKNAYSHPHDALQYVAVKVFGGSVRSRVQKPPQLRYEQVPA